MEWKKYSVGTNLSFLIPTFSIFIIFFSFYSERKLFFLIGVVLAVFSYINFIYEKNLGNKLHLINSKQQKCTFQQEETEWVITFRNSGFPIIGGTLTIIFDKTVEPMKKAQLESINSYHVKVPFSIGFNQEVSIKIPLIAKKRGLTKIRAIEMVIPQIFGFDKTILEYNEPFLQEILVYSKSRVVGNIDVLESMKMGDVSVKQSLYFDYLAPVGSRDYTSTDSFKQINWKATAKMQKLQTKVFEPIADSGLHLTLNIVNNHSVIADFEEQIEYLTFVIYYLEKLKIPYSISINFRSQGSLPFYYLPKGLGKTQLQTALKLLAVVDQLFLPYSFEKMMGYYLKHLNTQPYILHFGNYTTDVEKIYYQIQKTNVQCMYVHAKNGEGTVRPIKRGGKFA